VDGAAKQFEKLSSGSSVVVREFISKVVRRVVVNSDRIEIEIGKQALIVTLAPKSSSSSPQFETPQALRDVIRLGVVVRLKRCGGEMRIVFPPDLPGSPTSHPVSSLLKAVARGHTWRDWILAGEVSGRRAIAKKVGLDERYVRRVLECAFLAPDIVESILDGRQPSNLTFAKLTRGLPMSWVEQRQRLGFSSVPSQQSLEVQLTHENHPCS
jgi:hypothetical protein